MDALHPSAAAPADLAQFWARKTRSVRRFVNSAWLVESLLPHVFIGSLIVTAAIFVVRRQGWDERALGVLAGVLALTALGVALVRARRHFISEAEARAEIESGLRLHSRLSSAAAGVGPWPAPEQWRPTAWRWHWRKLAVLPLASAALLVAALLLPIVPNLAENRKPPVAKPPSLEKVESMLEKLAATPEIEPASMEAMRNEAQQIAKQDPADWYSHANLEAADHLKSKLQSGLKSLTEGASKIEKLLGKDTTDAGPSWKEKLDSALSALQGNVPAPNPKLTEALAGLDPSKFRSITPEQLAQLKKNLEALQEAARHGGGEPGEDGEGTKGDGQNGEAGDGEGTEDGEDSGQAGVSRGPGTAPVKLGATPTDLGTTKTQGLENEDLSHAALGEAVGRSAGQHEVDKTKDGRANAGGTAATGEGAGAVWQQQHVTPEERKRLQQFFQ